MLSVPWPRDTESLSKICTKDERIYNLEKKGAKASEYILKKDVARLRTRFFRDYTGNEADPFFKRSIARRKAIIDSYTSIERMCAIRRDLRDTTQQQHREEQTEYAERIFALRQASETCTIVSAYVTKLSSSSASYFGATKKESRDSNTKGLREMRKARGPLA